MPLSKLFGKSSAASKKGPSTNESIQKLGDSIDVIEKREAVINKKIEGELQKAREASKKNNKNLAMQHLKRKKAYEGQLEKLTAQKDNIMQMQMKLEEAQMNIETLNAQKTGASAISLAYGKMTPDKIDDDMDKVRETMQNANEISDAISQPLGSDMIDEDDLLNELEQLEQEDLDVEMLGISSNHAQLPKVPKHAVKHASKDEAEEDDMLAQLEAQLNA